jgi:hypothetical protein
VSKAIAKTTNVMVAVNLGPRASIVIGVGLFEV